MIQSKYALDSLSKYKLQIVPYSIFIVAEVFWSCQLDMLFELRAFCLPSKFHVYLFDFWWLSGFPGGGV